MGATILTTAAATSPLSRRHFRHRRGLRQLHTFVLLLGVLMLAISPEVLEGESIATSAFHAITDAAGAPRPAAGGGRWTSWLLLVALSLSAAVATGILPLPHSLVARLLASGGIGASLGLWLCGTFLPPSPSIYALTAAACVLALSYATFTRCKMLTTSRFVALAVWLTWQVLYCRPDRPLAHAHAAELRSLHGAVPCDVPLASGDLHAR